MFTRALLQGRRGVAMTTVPLVGQDAVLIGGRIKAAQGPSMIISLVRPDGTSPTPENPVYVVMRSVSLFVGKPIICPVTSLLTVVLPVGSTLGHVDNRDQQIIVYAINSGTDDAPVVELAVATFLFEPSVRLLTTTAISGSATLPFIPYTTVARSNVPWVAIARCISNQSSRWNAALSQIDLAPFSVPTNSVRVQPSADLAIASATVTTVKFDTAIWDADGCFDGVNFLFQPKVNGKYIITASMEWLSLSDGTRQGIGIHVSGAEAGWPLLSQGAGGLSGAGVHSQVVGLNGTSDYVQLFAWHDNDAGVAATYNHNRTFMEACRLGI